MPFSIRRVTGQPGRRTRVAASRGQWPLIARGAYGCCSSSISFSVSSTETAATASSTWCGLVAPMIGAVTVFCCSSQARAIRARGTSRVAAIRATASTISRSPSW